jgi:putative Ca2+/H+ antiporter (TMEM165/GDT1 family)
MVVAVTFFLAELGDKTMLSTVALATNHNIWMVWIGSTLGMVIADGLAIIVGQVLGKNLPERAVRMGAAVIFFAFGAYSGVSGAIKLPAYAWGAGLVAIAAMLIIYHRTRPAAERCPVGRAD